MLNKFKPKQGNNEFLLQIKVENICFLKTIKMSIISKLKKNKKKRNLSPWLNLNTMIKLFELNEKNIKVYLSQSIDLEFLVLSMGSTKVSFYFLYYFEYRMKNK
jgi:hypothetical protein